MTLNLKLKDIDAATDAKHHLEEIQRAEARERKEKEVQWETRVSFRPVSQHIVAFILRFLYFMFYVYLKLFVLYVISPLFKGVFLGGKVSGPEGCLMFDLFSFLAAVPRGWRVLGL